MRILSISVDRTIADPQSPSASRQRAYYEGWDVDILILSKGEAKIVELSPSLRVHVVGGRNKIEAFWRGLQKARLISKFNSPEVISAQDPFWTALVAWLICFKSRAKLHLQDHSGFFARTPFTIVEKIMKPFAKFLARRATRIRTVSERGKKGLLSIGIPENKIDVIPIATDIFKFSTISQPDFFKKNVLCIARLEKEKGVDILLEAWRKVVDTFPDARLRIVGDGNQRCVLEDQAASLSIADSVEFRGAVSDVIPELSWASVYVQPSRFEGWGMAVIEAAVAGRPVVMTDVGCAGEVIRDGETGIVVPVGDVPALATALVKLLRDPILAGTLGRAAHAVALRLPSPSATIESVRQSLNGHCEEFTSGERRGNPIRKDISFNQIAALRQTSLAMTKNGKVLPSLLVVTQSVDLDDPVLGFFHRWLELLAEATDRLTVICLREGRHTLPKNVLVLSLGKESGPSRMKYVRRFYSYIFHHRRAYDGVLVHMNPEYAILGGLFWRLMRKHVLLWYVHKSVTQKLRLAVQSVHGVLTASRESFRLTSPKVQIVGHGVDTEIFTPADVQASLQEPRLLTVGRISESKDVRTLINAIKILRSNGRVVTLDIAGDAATEADKVYLRELQELVDNKRLQESVRFLGPITYTALPALYRSHTIFVHASRTGSIDKTVLEALACGLPVITSSEAFVGDFAPYVKRFPRGDATALAETIKLLLSAGTVLPNSQAVNFIRERYDLKRLISAIVDSYAKDVLSSQY